MDKGPFIQYIMGKVTKIDLMWTHHWEDKGNDDV